jgi:very-short-patch-repair endonuclease
MQTLNLKIIRFTNDEVSKNGEVVVGKLKDFIGKIRP